MPLECKDLFNPENNKKSASVFTNEKKWALKTLSNLSKDTTRKWLGQDFNPGGLVSKAWALSTGWESRAHNGPLGECSVTHCKLFLPTTWRGFCVESNIFRCGRWRHISLTGKLTRNANLFLLNCWMGPRNLNFNTLSRWEHLKLDLQMQRALRKVVRDGGGQGLLSLTYSPEGFLPQPRLHKALGGTRPVSFLVTHQPLSASLYPDRKQCRLTESVRMFTIKPKVSNSPVTGW